MLDLLGRVLFIGGIAAAGGGIVYLAFQAGIIYGIIALGILSIVAGMTLIFD